MSREGQNGLVEAPTSVEVSLAVGRADLALGVVATGPVQVGPQRMAGEDFLEESCRRRATKDLAPAEERMRQACRNILRNGRYKPTGRAKPASEYLLRAAREGQFPRVSDIVDAANLVSLHHCIPLSLCDLGKTPGHRFLFRLGASGESFVFNQAGQSLDLTDLVCGCWMDGQRASHPCVTPVKDSQATKISAATQWALAAVYFPLAEGGPDHLNRVLGDLDAAFADGQVSARTGTAICPEGASVRISLSEGL